jgi:hypothetical protein
MSDDIASSFGLNHEQVKDHPASVVLKGKPHRPKRVVRLLGAQEQIASFLASDPGGYATVPWDVI